MPQCSSSLRCSHFIFVIFPRPPSPCSQTRVHFLPFCRTITFLCTSERKMLPWSTRTSHSSTCILSTRYSLLFYQRERERKKENGTTQKQSCIYLDQRCSTSGRSKSLHFQPVKAVLSMATAVWMQAEDSFPSDVRRFCFEFLRNFQEVCCRKSLKLHFHLSTVWKGVSLFAHFCNFFLKWDFF